MQARCQNRQKYRHTAPGRRVITHPRDWLQCGGNRMCCAQLTGRIEICRSSRCHSAAPRSSRRKVPSVPRVSGGGIRSTWMWVAPDEGDGARLGGQHRKSKLEVKTRVGSRPKRACNTSLAPGPEYRRQAVFTPRSL